ncbi:MAG TPA: threonine/serine dehydratase [Candidatus Acidoferrales bacterium]|nr:threonine/serine dehydratase [Candidatus Acidoferrales bacterium]
MNVRSDLALHVEDVEAAAERLRGIVVRTPVVTSERLDALAGNQLFLKCENLQRIGAFKFRGAYNRLSLLSPQERKRGVVAFSSGNHAQGVALAASLLGIAATIVMPEDAPAMKLANTRELQATVVTYKRQSENREAIAAEIGANTGATLISPFDDAGIMAGQGTAALELCEQVPDLDALVVPLGGGGLLSGCAVAARSRISSIELFGVEPSAGDDWRRSLERGEPVRIALPDTIADGLQATSPGVLTWPIVRSLASGVVTVTDDEIRTAMRLAFEATRLIVEPSGAVAIAAAVTGKLPLRGRRIGVVISGGNVDPGTFRSLVAG